MLSVPTRLTRSVRQKRDATVLQALQDCRAAGHLGFGGGAHVKGWVRQSGGFQADSSSCAYPLPLPSRSAIALPGSPLFAGGSVRFVNCHASAAAGALAVWGLAQTGNGEGVHRAKLSASHNITIVASDWSMSSIGLDLHECCSSHSCRLVHGNARDSQNTTGGNMTFHNCSSRRDGGGLYVKDGGLRQSGRTAISYDSSIHFVFGQAEFTFIYYTYIRGMQQAQLCVCA